MITQLGLTDFKAFSRARLKLAPLTLILGPNNSGKSSVLAPLRLLTQTMESYDVDVPLLLNGPFGDFGTFKDVVHGNHRGRPLGLAVDFRMPETPRSRGLEGSHVRIDLQYKHRMRRRETILRRVDLRFEGRRLATLEYSADSNRHTFARILDRPVPPPVKAALGPYVRMRHFLPLAHILPSVVNEGSTLKDFFTDEIRAAIRLTTKIGNALWAQFQAVEYLGAMREPPQRTYLFSGEKRRRVGASGEFATSLFMLDTMRRGKGRRNLRESVSQWLSAAGIAEDVFVEMISDRHYELRVKHPVTGESQNFSDVGYGNSQIFPVLVAGFQAQPDSMFLVEEPEIHLHPRAQAELGDFFLQMVERRVQCLVETHSEYLVLRLQRHVASGRLAPEDVAFYYVHPQADGQRKVLRRMSLDEDGRFVEEWPAGFFPERLAEARELSRARMPKPSGEA